MKKILEMLQAPDEDDVDEDLDAIYIRRLIVMLGQMRILVMKVKALYITSQIVIFKQERRLFSKVESKLVIRA